MKINNARQILHYISISLWIINSVIGLLTQNYPATILSIFLIYVTIHTRKLNNEILHWMTKYYSENITVNFNMNNKKIITNKKQR